MRPGIHTYIFLCGIGITAVLSSCSKKKVDATSTNSTTKKGSYSGVLNVSADETLAGIIKQQKELFEFYFDSVKVNLNFKPENEIITDFRKGNADVIIMARLFTKDETNAMKITDTLYLRQVSVAYDAVALIGNNKFDDLKLDSATLKLYLQPGKSKTQLVFDNQNSSVVKFMVNQFAVKEKLSDQVYALKTADEVIEYVSKNENAIGFISYNMISDTDEPEVKKILKEVKILNLTIKNKDGILQKTSANQSDIAEGIYPLIRNINAVSRFSYDDNLPWLFMNFLYKEKAAKVFLKAGLIPAKMPEREIKVNTEGLKPSN